MLVIGIVVWIFGFGLLAFLKSLSPPVGAQTVVSPFKPWDGSWEGEFTVYKWNGEPMTRLRVKQTYRHIANEEHFVQEGHFETVNLETGEKKTEKAANTAEFDGSGLHCKVIKEGGRVVEEHTGRIEDGALFWSRSIPGALESFREWIEGDTYYIEGFGIYGDRAEADPVMFVGRYQRVIDNADADDPSANERQ